MSDPIQHFVRHVVATSYDDLPDAAIAAAKTFILDSVGVGLIGSVGPWAKELIEVQALSGTGQDARVWSHGTWLPAPSAAMCNAYQIHNSEFDCVHEEAVVHAVTVVLPSVIAVAERMGGITGKQLIEAVALGVDVACHLSVAAASGLKFFRPATAGAFAAVTGIAKLRQFDETTLTNAYSIVYGQLSGTMQAHTEGSMLLAMQIAFNARNAVTACDMAAAGLTGPKEILTGEFGLYNLIEDGHELDKVLPTLGKIWRITEMAHKPFPSGRATHGVVDAVVELMAETNVFAADIASADICLPPLTYQLVGRPVHDAMDVNYARLCVTFVAARLLQNGKLQVSDFYPDALSAADSLELAGRFTCQILDNPDPNALSPVRVDLHLTSGKTLTKDIDLVLGNPLKPLSLEGQLEKFRNNAAAAAHPLDPEETDALIDFLNDLERVTDLRDLVDRLVP